MPNHKILKPLTFGLRGGCRIINEGDVPWKLIYKPLTFAFVQEVLCSFPNRSVIWAESQRIVETSLLLALTIPSHE